MRPTSLDLTIVTSITHDVHKKEPQDSFLRLFA